MAGRFQNEESFEKLLSSFRQGNQASFGQLYDKYAPALFGVISRILDNPELSCDCLQHCFNQIWNQRTSYDFSKERIFTWMIKIARNSALCFLKNGYGSFEPAGSTPSERQEDMKEKNETVSTSHNEPGSPALFLNTDQQEVLYLVYMKGFTLPEAATMLNIPVETAKLTYILAVKNLRGKVAV